MATPISELLVKISADSSGLETGLNKATKSTDNFSKNITQALAGAVAAMGVMDKAIQGIQFNAMAEQAQVAFTTMLGSGEKAQALIEDMFDFAKTTPFDFPGVRDAGKQLLAFGIESDKIIPSLKMLGDVGAGVGAPIGELAYLFGQVATQGKAMTQDINQFTSRGIPMWEELGKITGKTGIELRKMVEQGKIGFPEIEQAFKNLSGEGGDFFNLMEKQSETFTGAMSNLGDSFDMFLGKMTKDFMGPLEGGARALTTFIEVIDKGPPVLKNAAAMAALVGTALLAAIPAVKLFGITLNTSVLGPIGVITAAIGVLSLEVFNLMGKLEENQKSEDFLKDFDKRMATGTATARDYERALKIVGDQQKIMSDRSGQWYNPISGVQNVTGDTSRNIAALDKYKNAVLKNQSYILMSQNEAGKISAELARKEADEKMRLLTAEQKAAEKAYAETLTLEQAKSEGVLDLYLQTDAWKKKIDDEYSESLAWNLDTQQEYHEKRTDEVLAYELYSLDIQLAAEEARIAKEKKLLDESVADKKKAHDKYYSDLETASSGTFRILGALNDAFDLGIGETLKNLDTLSGGIIEVFKSGGTSVAGWLDTAVGAIGLIGQAWEVFSGEKARKDEEARQAEIKAFEDTAKQRLETTIEGLERERAEEISKAIAIGAQTMDIEIYYARATARARITANESVLAEQKRIEEESRQIKLNYAALAQKDYNEIARRRLTQQGLDAGNVLDLWYSDKRWMLGSIIHGIFADAQTEVNLNATNLSKSAIEGLEMSFALFGDRATEASKGLASAMVGGFQSGESEADIKSAIFDMLQNMAIEAAIMAAGIGDKFEVIGAQIAEALRDGFMDSSELSGIEAEINKLYESASKTVSSVAGIFNKTGGISNDGSGGSIPYGDASKYSAASLSGGPVFNFNSPIALNPSQTEAMFTVTARQLAFQGVL